MELVFTVSLEMLTDTELVECPMTAISRPGQFPTAFLSFGM